MARRTPAQVYAQAIAAGFGPAEATILTAIAGAESGYDNAALGDLNLQTNTWGPSYGLFQIRTVRADTGRGTDRDITRLAGSDAAQAAAAYRISGAGTDWSPWSVYTSGRYRAFLPAAQQVAQTAATDPKPFPTWGPSWLPWNWPSDAGNAAAGQALGGARNITIEAVFVILGIGLLAGGAFLVVQPQVMRIGRPVLSAVKGLL